MTIRSTAAALVLASGMATAVSSLSAQGNPEGKKFEKGSTVTLQGCVANAEKKDTYVLTSVREWPMSSSDMGKFGKRMYWIDKNSKDMKDHLGDTVQLIGKITDVEKSEIEIKAGEKGPGMVVEIEGPGANVVTSAERAGVSPESRPNKDDIPITLLKLKIEEVKKVSSGCSSTSLHQ